MVSPLPRKEGMLQEEGVEIEDIPTEAEVGVLLPMDVEGMVGLKERGKTAKGQEQVVAVVAITDQREQPTAAAEDRMVS